MSQPALDPTDPALLLNIKRIYLDPKISGEEKNKQVIFLVCASAFTKRPLSCIIKGPSGAGKSWLVNRVLEAFRKMGCVIEFSRITGAYLDNMANKDKPRHPNTKDPDYESKLAEYEEQRKKLRSIDLTGKIIFIDELRGIQSAQAPKLLISEGRLRLGTVINGEPVEIEAKGFPVIITTTTLAVLDDPEFENRVIPVQIDETVEQTERILEYEASSYGDPAEDLGEHARTQALLDLFKQLKPYDVANPYAWQLARDYPKKNLEARRDYRKLMDLSNVVTWLSQHQRVHAKKNLDVFLVAELTDIEKVKDLALPSLKESLTGISDKEQAILDFLKDQVEVTKNPETLVEKPPSYKSVTVKQIYQGTRKKTRRQEDWTRKYAKRLAADGYVEEEEVKPNRFEYRYAELQPETLEINTTIYPNQVREEWAKAKGYRLLAPLPVNSSISQGQAESIPYPDSEPVPSGYLPYQHETQATSDYRVGQGRNAVVDELTAKGGISNPLTIEKVGTCTYCGEQGLPLRPDSKGEFPVCQPCFDELSRRGS